MRISKMNDTNLDDHQNTLNRVSNRQASSHQFFIWIVSILALIYLLIIPFGRIKKPYEVTDLAIFVVVLLINSDLVDRVEKFSFKGGGGEITVDIAKLKEEQDNQKDKIEANTDIIQRLTYLEHAVTNNNEDKKLFYQSLVDENELKHLQELASDRDDIEYEFNYPSFKQELRRLHALGFIANKPEKHISWMKNKGNLRDYVEITERGREFLKLRE